MSIPSRAANAHVERRDAASAASAARPSFSVQRRQVRYDGSGDSFGVAESSADTRAIATGGDATRRS